MSPNLTLNKYKNNENKSFLLFWISNIQKVNYIMYPMH